jgi:chromate reductase, NAD(P)H dehydrogenase (quinone)
MKIIAFGASNSSNSINKKLATYTANLFNDAIVEVLDLNDFEMPLFGIDIENTIGKHQLAILFLQKIASADLLVVSLAEHNGNYSVAFKNIFDWCTRIQREVFQNKSMLLLGTSPGGRGAISVLELAEQQFPRFGANIKAVFSLPNFEQNFDHDEMVASDYKSQIKSIVENFKID